MGNCIYKIKMYENIIIQYNKPLIIRECIYTIREWINDFIIIIE